MQTHTKRDHYILFALGAAAGSAVGLILGKAGVFAQGIAYPTVARDKGRVRTIVTATHTPGDLEEALNIFETVGRQMQII